MSISTIFVDRVSAYPNQYRLVPQSGTPSLVTLERADEPTTPGTPLNAQTLNGLVSQINAMEAEMLSYVDNKASVMEYATARSGVETLALSQGTITPLALDTWGTKSSDNFTFSEGGMVMPSTGVILVFGAVYFNTSSPANPEELGVYLKKNGEEMCGQKSYCIGMTTVHLSPVTLEVEEGDVLHLCARNTTLDENNNYVDGSCIPSSKHTALTVYYLGVGDGDITPPTVDGARVECTDFVFNRDSVTVGAGKGIPLPYTVTPANCTDSIIWTSSNRNVVNVSNGIITTIAPGTATITAICGNYSDTIAVEVLGGSQTKECTGITITSNDFDLTQGTSGAIQYTVTPEDCTERVYWYSSNPAVAVVNSGVVGAISKGTATITATCGDYSASMEIDVFPGSITVETVKCTGITFKYMLGYTLTKGMSMPIEYTVTPEGCTERVFWSSSDPSILVVDNGVIAGVAEGTATVTATCGAYSATMEIEVLKGNVKLNSASTISGGTFAGAVVANSSGQTPGVSLLRNSKLVSADTNPTVNGEIFWTYK